jgi:uncharacterized membrane protein YuzA (DUF378 family)
MALQLHQDPEVALSSAVGFVAVGKILEWLSGHAQLFASISYVLAALAALVTIYYKVKNQGK